MQSPTGRAPISPEAVSRAGATALLLGVALVELYLEFWAAGWWHRSAACVLAVASAGVLVQTVAAVALPRRLQRALRPASREHRPRVQAAAPIALAEWVHR